MNTNVKYIIKYSFLIGMLLIGLSCDENALTGPNTTPEYKLSMNIIGSNDAYYADSCAGCVDQNPIEVQVNLTKNNIPESGAEIILTYQNILDYFILF